MKSSLSISFNLLLFHISILSSFILVKSFSFFSTSVNKFKTESIKSLPNQFLYNNRPVLTTISGIENNNIERYWRYTTSLNRCKVNTKFDHNAELEMPPLIRGDKTTDEMEVDTTNDFSVDIENSNHIDSIREYCICNSANEGGEECGEQEVNIVLDETSREEYLHPELITINAFDTLIKPMDEIGIYFREALLKVFDYTVRLPNPATFTQAFHTAYEIGKKSSTTFGASEGVSVEEWWAPIIYRTYLSMGFPKEDIDEVFVDIFDELQNEVLVSPMAWELNYDTIPVLEKLYEWRMRGNGPKLGVIANFDDRLELLLENLNIAHYFDLIISAREFASSMPQRQIFDIALAKTGINSARKAIHIGNDITSDIVGANRAGWKAVYVQPPPWRPLNALNLPPLFDEETGKPVDIKYARVGDLHGVLRWYGLDDPNRLVETTFRIRNRPDNLKSPY